VTLGFDYKKHYRNVDREKGGDQEGMSEKRVTEANARQTEALVCDVVAELYFKSWDFGLACFFHMSLSVV
jgi:hypothetical protein